MNKMSFLHSGVNKVILPNLHKGINLTVGHNVPGIEKALQNAPYFASLDYPQGFILRRSSCVVL